VTVFDGIVLGLVQGLTEFLPVSSSGHLVLMHSILGLGSNHVAFDVFLHVGTLLSLFVVMWREVWRLVHGLGALVNVKALPDAFRSRSEVRILSYLALASVPAAIAGFAFEADFDRIFGAPRATACFLVVTGVILFVASRAREAGRELTARTALLMGVAQAFALLPGISRSGTTLASGLASGVTRRSAVNFAFLMGIPAILGASLLKLFRGVALEGIDLVPLLVGMATAFVTGLLALELLIRVVIRGKLHWFGAYCLVVGLGAFLVLSAR
jgi:undecaprenyl-diphosphatase